MYTSHGISVYAMTHLLWGEEYIQFTHGKSHCTGGIDVGYYMPSLIIEILGTPENNIYYCMLLKDFIG